ncbi:uncharacterized protein LOC125655838 [Ostrea edulis]|uniref:uncharacterized protein LOC125655838 n=1 Tax=Ostrea edulis TaxID=37623 RepID=UPI0024AF5FFB|nr:uncharacterized protein LOC125655838 [Ostrea edulis]XP_056005247.1 uncharacterized protein LOC125655838 [Ostrea edulis]XP_056005252.1 uncharacterized protein LOC125655838 [Ostrea edulis]
MATRLDSKVKCDVMISYQKNDLEFTRKLAAKFEEQGWRVWFADPDMEHRIMVNQKGEAILSCKVFVTVITDTSARDIQCQDELALAYISNSSIFPVSLKKFRDIGPTLDGGMKLMLAKINWTFFFKEELYEQNMPALLISMGKVINEKDEAEIGEFDDSTIQFHGMNINVHDRLNVDSDEDEDNEDESSEPGNKSQNVRKSDGSMLSYDFWDRAFGDKSEVTWVDFKKKFEVEYKEKIAKTYTEEEWKLFVNLIYKDIFMLNKSLKKATYNQFCEGNPDADPHRFYHRLAQYAKGYHAMREVFNMDSTLRLITVQKLGEFCFPAVISGLTEMLKDEDPNIRAIATIALAKSGRAQKITVEKIIGMLEDDDRLVRESACLALGYLKAGGKSEQAVADRWRNDPIKSVREAAELALKRMGGDLAKKCIHITDILSSEMQFLKTPMS